MRLAVCIASRGMGHYRTIAGVIREIESVKAQHIWCWAFGLPIPDAQNECAAQALADSDVTHLWWCEDDHLLPPGCLAALIAADAPIAAIDYPLRNGPNSVLRAASGEVVLCGLGCTLIRREVFDVMPDPPFQTGTRLGWEGEAWRDTGIPEYAGGHDARFCAAVRMAGIPIVVLEGWEVGHLETVRAGDRTNAGMDTVRCWGGVGLPWYPEQRRQGEMPTEMWKSPGDLVLAYDTDEPGAAADIALRERAGWTRVSVKEAAPLIRSQERAQAAAAAPVVPPATAPTPEDKD